jgi:hypothetical protein
MKKTYFKIGLLLVLGLTATVFCSCNKNDNGERNNEEETFKIIATNVIGNTANITIVKALGDSAGSKETFVIAQTSFQGNGFVLELPVTLLEKHLKSMTDNIPEGSEFTTNDENAKWFFFSCYDLCGYDRNENNIGSFMPQADDEIFYIIAWFYVNKDVIFKGKFPFDWGFVNYDMNFQKGWNVAYGRYSRDELTGIGTEFWTSQKPSGVNFTWYLQTWQKE